MFDVEGGNPLVGSVKLSGARNSVLKLIPTAMFSNEDVVLDNVPHVADVVAFADVINKMGGKAEWLSLHRLVLNGSGLNSFEIPADSNLYYRVANLLVGPLVFRFGKAVVPKSLEKKSPSRPINRWIDSWTSLGFLVSDEGEFLKIEAGNLKGTDLSFKVSTHSGTDNAIISSLFVQGDTLINNAAEEPEVEDLISFANQIGGQVERIEPRRIKVTGKSVFRGARFEVQPDKNEAVVWAIAALSTGGNIIIENVDKTHLTAFVNVLSKMGARYEFSSDELRVWYNNDDLTPANVTATPAPGFTSDWLPYITLLLTRIKGESYVYDTVFTNRFNFIKDFNRMGAKIDLTTPAQAGLPLKFSDDSYNFEQLGEPFVVAKVSGPTKLKGTRLDLLDMVSAPLLVLAALSAEGRSEVHNFENADKLFDSFSEKLLGLGAKIYSRPQ